MDGTTIVFQIGAGKLIIGICAFFLGLLAIVWKGKSEISSAIKEETKDIFTSINNLRINLTTVCTHLSAGSSNPLNPNLLTQMSPLQIQPEGLKVLTESGFVEVFSKNVSKFFESVDTSYDKKPTTKYEVENYSIWSFIKIMNIDSILDTVKAYLYQHPDVRDTYTTLAGVYIRDRYLEKHPEIIQ